MRRVAVSDFEPVERNEERKPRLVAAKFDLKNVY